MALIALQTRQHVIFTSQTVCITAGLTGAIRCSVYSAEMVSTQCYSSISNVKSYLLTKDVETSPYQAIFL